MSLPLPRRIAQAALLLGAAAAPLIGAGAAHAAALPQQGLGGLTNLDKGGLDTGALDSAGLGHTVQDTSQQATTAVGSGGTQALTTAFPAADRLVGTLGRSGVPTAQKAAGQVADTAGRTMGATEESAGGSVPGAESLPTSILPNAGALPLAGALPTSALLTDQLPLKGLPVV
jgi:hypothetical protein